MEIPCKFLIIDDNEIDRLITSTLLRNQGIKNISQAGSGAEGINWINEHRTQIDPCLIILLDIKMPEMDGFEFLEAFEEMDESMKSITKVFMLSSTLDTHDIERAESHVCVEDLLTKPLAPSRLASYLH